jgi:uncharacterized protein (DUF2236 family)
LDDRGASHSPAVNLLEQPDSGGEQLRSQLVSAEDFERQLAIVRANAAGPREGLFGPRSLMWHVNREAAVFLGAGRALLLQLAHPWVAAAVAEHSHAFDDPIGRFHRTFDIVFTMVFGTMDQAVAAARRLHHRHTAIRGTLAEAAGPFLAGSIYQANEIAALRWVCATLIDTARVAHDLVLPPLTARQRECYYADSRLFAALFGIPQQDLPPNWSAFVSYNRAMRDSDTLTVTTVARAVARAIFAGSWPRVPQWYQALTAQLLPPRIREAFGFHDGETERRLAQRAIERLRWIYPLLPTRLRTVGPYQEAQARLLGQAQPDFVTQGVNVFWIGRRRLAP